MGTNRRGPRAVLAVGIVVGISSGLVLAASRPEQIGIATDVYYLAAKTALFGGDLYAVRPPDHPAFGFLYPPIVVLAFVPHVLSGSPTGAYVLQSLVNLATAVALGSVLVHGVRLAGVDLDSLDRWLIRGYALASFPVTSILVMGQVNLQLALAIALGALWLERGEAIRSGVAFGAAAVVKLFPALIGTWLLRRRAWRAILAATATGTGALLAGVFAFGPGLTVTYITEVLTREATVGSFTGRPNPASPYLTIRRQLAFLAPWLSSRVRTAIAVGILAPIVFVLCRSIEDYRDRLIAFGGSLLAILVLFPLEPFYLGLAIFPLVPLLYLFDPGMSRTLYLGGMAVLSIPVRMAGVEVWASTFPVGGELLLSIAETTFAFALPTMYGVWLVFAAFLLSSWKRRGAGPGQRS